MHRVPRSPRVRQALKAIGLTGALSLLATSPAAAEPQMSAAALTGLALDDLRTTGPNAAFHLGARADVLFLRERSRDMGLGPFVDVATTAFDRFDAGGGLSWLVPTFGAASVLSAGGFARTDPEGLHPGALASFFFGARDFNFHGRYGFAIGGFAEGRLVLDGSRSAEVIVGLQIDGLLLALPAMLAIEAFKH